MCHHHLPGMAAALTRADAETTGPSTEERPADGTRTTGELPIRQRMLPHSPGGTTLWTEVVGMTATEPGTGSGVDLGPFAHESEAAVCRRVVGDRVHGLDAVEAGV
jgi:hypothetical protein